MCTFIIVFGWYGRRSESKTSGSNDVKDAHAYHDLLIQLTTPWSCTQDIICYEHWALLSCVHKWGDEILSLNQYVKLWDFQQTT
jgi:hypothetical protein